MRKVTEREVAAPIAPGTLTRAVMSAVAWEGLRIETLDGQPAALAVIDAAGNVIESGQAVADEAWNVVVLTYRQFLIGKGRLRVYSAPTGLAQNDETHEDAS